MLSLPFTKIESPREAIRQFTPNWFTATMGTGILALALNEFPIAIPGLHGVAEGLWLFNIGLFVLFVIMYLARWIWFFDAAIPIVRHPVAGMFFGAIPMGLATILNGFLVFGVDRFGGAAVEIAHALWWVDAVLALVCAWVVPYLMFTRQEHSMKNMTAVWLLPIVAAEVTAASGGLLIPYLADSAQAVQILIFSYVLWAISVPLALSVLTILFLHLAVHSLPHQDMAVSSWLCLGPLCTGALGLMLLGADATRILVGTEMENLGSLAQGVGVIGGLMLWSYGLWWLMIAIMTTLRYLRQGLPFNMGWWGFTFPIGVYSVATLTLAQQTGLKVFAIIGGVLVVALALFWLIVTVRTLHGAYHGYLFVAPCLSSETGHMEQHKTSADSQRVDLA